MAPAAQSIRLDLQIPMLKYNDTTKAFSYRFFLGTEGVTIGDESQELMENVANGFSHWMGSAVNITKAYYYEPGSDVNADQREWPITGDDAITGDRANFNPTTPTVAYPEVCHMIRWPMQINSKGRRVYLRHYLHVGLMDDDSSGFNQGNPMPLSSDGTSALADASSNWADSSFPLTNQAGTAVGNDGELVPYLATRQMRRGPKKSS
jgi:hypothetical protein